jgi:hypothetical protein
VKLPLVNRSRSLFNLISRLAWDNRALTASRLIHITLTPRNEMDMTVHDCLARYPTTVHADVEALHCLVGGEDRKPNVIKQ